ncbi:MAG: c-type cytochrome [Bryobacteraceae bacterium]
MRCLTILAAALSALAQPSLERGASIYAGQCAICHGQRGEGGRGATLARPKLRNAQDEETLQRIIRRGLPGTGMPGTWLNESELADVSAHVRSLGRSAPVTVPGDGARGEAVYRKSGCARCHTIAGLGGAFGPDLSGIGARRSPAHLRQSVVDPAADVSPDFVLVHAGKLSGARVNEDSFSIQIRDAAGKIHSLWKSEAPGLRKEFGKTAMPSYRASITGADLEDLVAYLAAQEDAQ